MLERKSHFLWFQKMSNHFFFCDFSKLGHKRAKVGKYVGICMENGQKIALKADDFFVFTPNYLKVYTKQVHRSTNNLSSLHF